ncbi:SGNH/GDSL hydrolase family protein [Rhodococcus tukisamuensis]|uniref:Lysophospholipase L1 n=1 Tax=Rhodococcus tukisamuensis TaxID=168276 RepID=A0A1G7ALU2_9NOCA|nr:SGNH/GDSL hydrolase family protein [Rhodococcus tukisamuensis]SDE15690.1 Lysophospholipase L1 [Rhodococcus tukisamuensis]
MTRRRWPDVALIALAAAVLIGLAVVVASPDTATPTPTPAAAPVTGQIDRPHPDPGAPPTVLFIGDSYTGGSGPLAEMSYACLAAARMRWHCDLSAVPGTGYISGGPPNRFVVNEYTGDSTSFSERVPKLAAGYQPDIVVLDGGRNDLFAPGEDVFKAMAFTIGEARRAWPAAKMVFLRPRLLSSPRDDLGFDDGFMARLESDPAADGVLFLDPIADAPFADGDTSALLASDGKHPDPRGDAELGTALVASLIAHGVDPAP